MCRFDAASLVRLALEKADDEKSVHGVAEEGTPTSDIVEAFGAGRGIPVVSIPTNGASERFGWTARFIAADATASSQITGDRLSWEPTQLSLMDDLATISYFRAE